jgi:hypothetical protein
METDICEEFSKNFINYCLSSLDKDTLIQFNSVIISEFLMENEEIETNLNMLFSEFLTIQRGLKYTDFVKILDEKENIILYTLYTINNTFK